jgi:hypothetical protein
MPVQQGMNQQTPAVMNTLRNAFSKGTRAVRKVKRAVSAVKRVAKKATGSKLKFGSPAWQKKYKVGKFAKAKRKK